MKSDEMSWFKHVLSLSVIIIFAGFLFYLYDSEYRGDKIATEEQLLDISHEIPCAGEDFRTALRNSPGPLTLRDAKKIAAKCNEKYKQLNALNAMSK